MAVEAARTDRLATGAPLPDHLPDHLIVFDGACVLCSGWARWIARHDPQARFRFATAQSPIGEALFRAHGLPVDSYQSNLVIIDGVAYTKLDTVQAVAGALGWPWKAARIVRLLPQGAQDWIYDRIAKNRFALFGARDACAAPTADMRGRLLG